ncbi:Transposase IS66 family protein [compost metagenome]
MLTPTYQSIKQHVQSAACVNADETRYQRGGERLWMWFALSPVVVMMSQSGCRNACLD